MGRKALNPADALDREYAERCMRLFFAAVKAGNNDEAAELYNEITGSLNCVLERNGIAQV